MYCYVLVLLSLKFNVMKLEGRIRGRGDLFSTPSHFRDKEQNHSGSKDSHNHPYGTLPATLYPRVKHFCNPHLLTFPSLPHYHPHHVCLSILLTISSPFSFCIQVLTIPSSASFLPSTAKAPEPRVPQPSPPVTSTGGGNANLADPLASMTQLLNTDPDELQSHDKRITEMISQLQKIRDFIRQPRPQETPLDKVSTEGKGEGRGKGYCAVCWGRDEGRCGRKLYSEVGWWWGVRREKRGEKSAM